MKKVRNCYIPLPGSHQPQLFLLLVPMTYCLLSISLIGLGRLYEIFPKIEYR